MRPSTTRDQWQHLQWCSHPTANSVQQQQPWVQHQQPVMEQQQQQWPQQQPWVQQQWPQQQPWARDQPWVQHQPWAQHQLWAQQLPSRAPLPLDLLHAPQCITGSSCTDGLMPPLPPPASLVRMPLATVHIVDTANTASAFATSAVNATPHPTQLSTENPRQLEANLARVAEAKRKEAAWRSKQKERKLRAGMQSVDAAAAPSPTDESHHVPRRQLMTGSTEKAYTSVRPDTQCRRCGMTDYEHRQYAGGQLEKHHVVALRDGGHPTDPSNLHTLCYFCHKEWHTWWEGEYQWTTYMATAPYWQAVPKTSAPHKPRDLLTPANECCVRCHVSAQRCLKLRPDRRPLKPFQPKKTGPGCSWSDFDKPVCFWCQREWEIFWEWLRPDTELFFAVPPFRPTPPP